MVNGLPSVSGITPLKISFANKNLCLGKILTGLLNGSTRTRLTVLLYSLKYWFVLSSCVAPDISIICIYTINRNYE